LRFRQGKQEFYPLEDRYLTVQVYISPTSLIVGTGPVVEGGEKAAERVVQFLKGEKVSF